MNLSDVASWCVIPQIAPKNVARLSPCGRFVAIELTRGVATLIDAGDWIRVKRFRWYTMAVKRPLGGEYRAAAPCYVDGRRTVLYMHVIINGTPRGAFTDHANHDSLDNRRVNLRTVTPSESAANRRKRKTRKPSLHRSRFIGVAWARVDGGRVSRHKATGNISERIRSRKAAKRMPPAPTTTPLDDSTLNSAATCTQSTRCKHDTRW